MKRVSCCTGLPVGSQAEGVGVIPEKEHEYGQALEEERDGVLCCAAWYKWESWSEPEMRYTFQMANPIVSCHPVDIAPPEWADEWLERAEGILSTSYEKFRAYCLEQDKPIPRIETSA